MVREEAPPVRVAAAPPPRWQERHGGTETAPGRPAAADSRLPSGVPAGTKVGRNDPCPCGSGKKYKKCHALNGA
jgi:preprotein translocase subunit SecA